MNAEVPTASTPIEIYRRGLTVLQGRLGPVDSIRFRLFDSGSGDYTAERHVRADEGGLNALCDEIRATTGN
jgi:hypothetical protein